MNPAARWPLWTRMSVAGILGGLAAFGLAPTGLWPLTLAMLLVVPALFGACTTTRQAAMTGWALGLGWFAHALIWIIEPFLVDVARYGWMAPFAIILMAGVGALFWAVGFGLAHRLGRTLPIRILALIVLWSLVEFARAYILTGFPWAALAQIWPDTDAALLLAWIGPHGLALTTLVVTLLPGLALFHPGAMRGRLAMLFPAVLFVVASFALAQARPDIAPLTDATVRLVQPNAPQHQKWDPAHIPVFFNRQIEFTAADAPTGARPDLIVWPETSVPVLLNHAAPELAAIADAAAGTPVVLGIQRADGLRFFNALVYLDENGAVAGTYDKHHLVPFGEYIPLGDLAARFGLQGFAAQNGDGYSPGPGARLLSLGTLGTALPLICYEAVFAQDVGAAPGRPNFLLQITNDAWFGERTGPYQHLAQAQMRAIEQGLPMIRAANTGVSAMIDPWGRLTAQLPLGQAGYLDAALPAPIAATLYARMGDMPLLIILLLAMLALGALQSRHMINT